LAIAALKDELETDNADKIKSGIQNVTEASMRLGEAIYKASQDDGADESPMDAANRDTDGADDDILDADFEDLGGDKR
jgi:molecular chaperone DnaK